MRQTRRTIADILAELRPIAGGDGTEDNENLPEDVREDAARIGEMSDEDLQAFEGRLVEAVTAQAEEDSDEAIATMEALAAVVDQVRSVRSTREADAQERAERRERILNAVASSDEGEGDGNDDENTEGEGDGEGDGETTTVETTTETEVTTEPEAVAAAATPSRPAPRPSNRNRPQNRAPREGDNEGQAVITAAGDLRGVSAGQRLDVEQLAAAFSHKAESLRGTRASGRYHVATLHAEYPEERTLVAKASAEENARRVRAVLDGIDQAAIVAAGGLCAPLEVDYSIPTISTDDRPVRDSLARFGTGAARGGIRYIEPPRISDLAGAVGQWTVAMDEDAVANEATRKPCLRIACGDEVTVELYGVTKCLEVGNFQRRTFQEQFDAFWGLAGAQHAREAEDILWESMVTASTAVTASDDAVLGAARDSIAHLVTAAAALRSRHRMASDAPLRLMLPEWTADLMSVDLARQLPGDNTYEITREDVIRWFARRNINLTFSPDAGGQVFGAQAAGAMLEFPATVEALLFPEGSFVFLDGGTLDFGIEIRDSVQNAKNDTQAFMETFEAVAFRGVESLAITIAVNPNGASSGTVAYNPQAA